jgi:hypothetical protein
MKHFHSHAWMSPRAASVDMKNRIVVRTCGMDKAISYVPALRPKERTSVLRQVRAFVRSMIWIKERAMAIIFKFQFWHAPCFESGFGRGIHYFPISMRAPGCQAREQAQRTTMKMRKHKRNIYARYAFGLRVSSLLDELAEAAELLKDALDGMDEGADQAEAAEEPRREGG